MKKILPVLLMMAVCFACKKDKSDNKQLLLSKVYEDGLLKTEYLYSADKKPYRRNSYSTGTGQSVLNGFKLYQYENGLLKEVADFDENNDYNNKYTLQYDINKRPSRMDFYSSLNALTVYYTFDYGPNGKLAVVTSFNPANNKKGVETQFKYDQQGHVTGVVRYSWLSNPKYTQDSSIFVFDKEFPSWWSYYEVIPIVGLPNGDKTFYDMICASSVYYQLEIPTATTEITYSNKTYNKEGLLTKQTISRKTTYTMGPPSTSTIEKTYEYTE